MPALKIRIGASIDANFPALFRPMVDAAKDAQAQIRGILNEVGGDVAKAAGRASAPRRTRAGAGAGAGSTGSTGSRGGYRDPAGPEAGPDPAPRRKRLREIETDQERHDRDMEAKRRKTAKEEAAHERQMEREADRRRERISSNTVSNFAGLARRGVGVAADLARGAGIDFSLAGAAQSRFDLQKGATDLSNSAYMPGAPGANGKRQDPRALMATVQEAADGAALDTGKTMEGLQAFVGKTGDLETGRAVLKDLAVLARATGADMNDIVSAAGDVSANLGDGFGSAEEKATAVSAVMRSIAGQGKVGAVEMKDLASQMAKLAASAPKFAGGIENSMAAMGVLAQEARSHGGAASATQATTSVQGFVATFNKKARRQAFKSAGVDIEDATGKLLDPEEIIVNSLKKTGGNKEKMNKLFMDAGAQRVTSGFQAMYSEASTEAKAKAKKEKKSAPEVEEAGRAAGEKAVREEFSKLRFAQMSKTEVSDSFNASMNTSEAQAQLLRNKLQKDLGDAVDKLTPQMIKLIPSITGATEAFGKLAGWAASNPLEAAFLGFGASVMKSVGEEMLRSATSRAFGGGGGGGAGGGGGGGGFMGGLTGSGAVSTAMNLAGAAFTISAATMTVWSVGKLAIDSLTKEANAGQENAIGDQARAINARGELRAAQAKYDEEAQAGAPTPETAARLDKAKADVEAQKNILRERIASGEERASGGSSSFLAAGANSLFGTNFFGTGENLRDQSESRGSALELEGLKAELQSLKDVQRETTAALKGGITILNMPEAGGPFVNPAGRVGP